ncbi:hypothetical protein KK083_21395 [Fulvivirgaceae bacterium PWU4]|uniref:Uncharacterized protein n=1 Tax=Chryseosolibacter histidini TaxID=2782349 RepID=A0AAP2DQP0_9BACT|nr:hypothetical protein [Chryseosolibacter histidini]MBT1699467.1 hypothetical protein [Chryseosolibacter histidini]
MSIIRPRLNDFHRIPVTQEDVDFAIPFIDEDIPLYVDPFLLWKSPSQQDNSLHLTITNSFNFLGSLITAGNEKQAIEILIRASECNEVGLGNSKTKTGKKIGEKLARSVLSVFKHIPQLGKVGFSHFEEIQLLVDSFSKDRVSDIACNYLQSFLIDFTIEQSEKHGIPIEKVILENVYDVRSNKFNSEKTYLPINPNTSSPILFVPKRWLKFSPWINPDDYFDNYYVKNIHKEGDEFPNRVRLLNFNRKNYDIVQTYTKIKEKQIEQCKNDPLFNQIPITSAKGKLATIIKLPTGKTENADRKYEDNVCQLMASLVYPHLDFAAEQSRTDSGVLIRDLVFYNNRSLDFLKEIYEAYDCRQIVMELKNVEELTRDHIFQLNRYLNDQFGRFGIIITRKAPLSKIFKNTIDLWSGQRRCILILDDSDLSMMTQVFESKQRYPIEVIKKKYIEFIRACPS